MNLVTGNSYPDDENIACQVETSFSANNDRIAVRIKQNGYMEEISGDHQTYPATDFFTSNVFLFQTLSLNKCTYVHHKCIGKISKLYAYLILSKFSCLQRNIY